jgi:hypothetical protein
MISHIATPGAIPPADDGTADFSPTRTHRPLPVAVVLDDGVRVELQRNITCQICGEKTRVDPELTARGVRQMCPNGDIIFSVEWGPGR